MIVLCLLFKEATAAPHCILYHQLTTEVSQQLSLSSSSIYPFLNIHCSCLQSPVAHYFQSPSNVASPWCFTASVPLSVCVCVLVNMIFLRHWTTFLTNRVRTYLCSDMLAGSHNFIITFKGENLSLGAS